MQKEKSVKSYTRRTKSGKTVVVHAYKAKYDAAEEMRKALAKKEGAGKELANKKKQVEQPIPDDKLGFSAEEFKAWYHWDTESDPKNKAAIKVEKALKKSMGAKEYKKFYDDMTDGYSARGHNKAFKGLEGSLGTSKNASSEPKRSKRATTPPTPQREVDSKTQAKWDKEYDKSSKAYSAAMDKYMKGIPKSLSPQDALKYHIKNLPKKDEFGDKIGVSERDKKILSEYFQSGKTHGRMDKSLVALRKAVEAYQKEQSSSNDTKKSEKPLTYGQAFKRAKDNFTKRRAAAKYEKPTNIKTLQSNGWQLHGRELPSLRSKKTQEAFLVSPDGKKMYRLSAAINPIGRGMIPMWRLDKNAELLDTTTAIRRKFEK